MYARTVQLLGLSHLQSSRIPNVVLSRDEIPRGWFWFSKAQIDTLRQGYFWFAFKDDADLEAHTIKTTKDEELAYSLEKVFLRYKAERRFRAQIVLERPADMLATAEILSPPMPTRTQQIHSEVIGETRELRGSRSRWSRKLFSAEHQKAFEAQLYARNSQGRLVYIGQAPSGSFVYVPYITSDLSFHDLVPKTPMIFINIATVDIDDHLVPWDGKRTRAFFPATHGTYNSIYIVIPRVRAMASLKRRVYVLPSWLMNTVSRKRWHTRLLAAPQELNTKRLFLHGGISLENYSCPYTEAMIYVVQIANRYRERLLITKNHVASDFHALYTGTSYLQFSKEADGIDYDDGEEDGSSDDDEYTC